AGTSNEVDFSALGRQAFMDTVRTLVEAPPTPAPTPPSADPGQALVQAGVQLLEGLAALLAPHPAGGNGQAKPLPIAPVIATDARTGQPVLQIPMPSPEVLQRGVAALQKVLEAL